MTQAVQSLDSRGYFSEALRTCLALTRSTHALAGQELPVVGWSILLLMAGMGHFRHPLYTTLGNFAPISEVKEQKHFQTDCC